MFPTLLITLAHLAHQTNSLESPRFGRYISFREAAQSFMTLDQAKKHPDYESFTPEYKRVRKLKQAKFALRAKKVKKEKQIRDCCRDVLCRNERYENDSLVERKHDDVLACSNLRGLKSYTFDNILVI